MQSTSMTIEEAQADMRHAYANGAAGVFASALVWLASGAVALTFGWRGAILTLFFGGMAIHPAAILLSKLAGRPGAHRKDNPLARLALEGTIWMLLALPVAFLLSFERPVWFFLAMLLAIGGRYLTFATLYGLTVYWACGLALVAASFALFFTQAPVASAAFTGGVIELAFAILLFRGTQRGSVPAAQP